MRLCRPDRSCRRPSGSCRSWRSKRGRSAPQTGAEHKNVAGRLLPLRAKFRYLCPFPQVAPEHLFFKSLNHLKLKMCSTLKQNNVVPGSQSTPKGHRPSRQPPRSERTASFRAGAKRPEYEAAAGAAAEEAAPGESAETASGDGDAAENSQSKGTPAQLSRHTALYCL